MSTHPPDMPEGGASSEGARWPSAVVEEQNYFDAAKSHGISGVDMLWLEMMKDEEHAPRAVRAAASAGLPVFLGISARIDPTSNSVVLYGNGSDAVPLKKEWFHRLAGVLGPNLVGVNVMHTNFSAMADTLQFVREDCGWTGPLGAYPDHGVFKAPEWVFEELDNEAAMKHNEDWINRFGVQLVGGCCGLGPEYITALSAFVRRHNADVRNRVK
jgi:methionine synthase I (cobalamin-dependent)